MRMLCERVARKGLIYAYSSDISQGELIFQVKSYHVFQRKSKSSCHLEAETLAGSRAQPMSKLLGTTVHKTNTPQNWVPLLPTSWISK